jgi:hypothetical protein
MNRHSLSLPPDSGSHRNALQAVTLSARRICSILWEDVGQDIGTTRVVWPAYVEMIFDAGMISAYGAVISTKPVEDRQVLSDSVDERD